MIATVHPTSVNVGGDAPSVALASDDSLSYTDTVCLFLPRRIRLYIRWILVYFYCFVHTVKLEM